MSFRSALYRGELMHARHDLHRVFRYPMYVASLDLDELPRLHRELRLFSHRRPNLFAFDERDYAATISPTQRTRGELCGDLDALRDANALPPPATTRLVTNLRVFGYTFNPVSFFLDYDARGELSSAIAEVNNTYGGRLRYVLGPRERVGAGFRHARELFVSPFLPGAATYDFLFTVPCDGESLAIEMHVTRDDTRVLTARLTATRTPLSDRALLAAAIRYPLMTAQVIALIHFEAFKLRLAGVPYRRPGPDHRPLV